jgi:dTDP-glucose 4,6-dehydratase
MPEDYVGAPDPANPRSAYGEAKRYAEVLCALYYEKFGIPIRIARPFTFVGPYQDLEAGFAVTDFLKAGLQGLPLCIRGDGTTVRSYCYASDMVVALWQVLLNGAVGRAYNVGSDEPISILDLARAVASVLSMPVDVVVSGKPVPGHKSPRYVPDITRGRSEFNVVPTVSLDEALRRTLQWAREMWRNI